MKATCYRVNIISLRQKISPLMSHLCRPGKNAHMKQPYYTIAQGLQHEQKAACFALEHQKYERNTEGASDLRLQSPSFPRIRYLINCPKMSSDNEWQFLRKYLQDDILPSSAQYHRILLLLYDCPSALLAVSNLITLPYLSLKSRGLIRSVIIN